MCQPAYVLFLCVFLLFRIPLCFPFGKFSLAFLALIKSKDVRHDTAGDGLNLVLRDVGVVDGPFSSTQVLSSVKDLRRRISLFPSRTKNYWDLNRQTLFPWWSSYKTEDTNCPAVPKFYIRLLNTLYLISGGLSRRTMVEKIRAERVSATTGLRSEEWEGNTISFADLKSKITFSTRSIFSESVLVCQYTQIEGFKVHYPNGFSPHIFKGVVSVPSERKNGLLFAETVTV